MDGSGTLTPDGLGKTVEPLAPDPSTTYCGHETCSTLRRIVKITASARFPILERVEASATGGRWEDTGRIGYERSVRLDCEHTKGVIGV